MEAATLIEQLETSPREARHQIRNSEKLPGLSRAFAARMLELYVSDSGAAIRLGSNWRHLLRYGDEAAPVHRVRGIVAHLRGRWRECASAFIEAGESAADPIERLSFQVGAVDALARTGRIAEATALGETLAHGLRSAGRPDLAARVHLNLGSAYFWQDRMPEAREFLTRAVAPLEHAGLSGEAASALMALSTTHLYSGDLAAARSYADRALTTAREHGFEHIADLSEINLAHADLLSGAPEKALERLLALQTRLSEVPADAVRVLEFLGDTYYRLNLWPESIDAYGEAQHHTSALAALHRGHLHLGLGQTLMASGRWQDAEAELARAARLYKRLSNNAWLVAAHTYQARAQAATGNLTGARRTIRQAISQPLTGYYAAEALLLAAELLGDQDALRKARRIIARNGYVGLLWRCHHLRAKFEAKPLPHYRHMFSAIVAGRLEVSSIGSRAAYLRDKADAIRDYLGELLKNPTSKRVQEAVSVIEQTRSVTLLDELVSAGGASISDQARERLQELREELQRLGVTDAHSGPARRGVSLPLPIGAVQRRWLDVIREVRANVNTVLPPARKETVIFAGTPSGLHAIGQERHDRLSVTPKELEKQLRWLQFELLAPLSDRDADGTDANRIVQRLASKLLQDGTQDLAICPEGTLWRVPWAACAGSQDREVELRLHPSLGGNTDRALGKGRIALWTTEAADLEHAKDEANAFLSTFPNAEVFRTAGEIRNLAGNDYELIHVIGHAKHRSANPMFSSIQFSDGPLFATEIARSGIRSSLVTLSACETGTMSTSNRDEPDGLARAFLARGAANVIASMWPLDDEAATRIFSTFFNLMQDGATVRDGLHSARREARIWRSHPYFWGSLALYGGYIQ